ncbi:hypothetical protein [Oricola nitratireducens]|jgi:hypothetical protein|uniref:hypothetical protein n=1 Tax=Oricola nitratireducens TaxID=2775868 RepID=UPI001865DEAC|nr:hypothetical protein [Oricola nitratireducens]
MNLIQYSIAGTAACIAAVGGVMLQVTLSQPSAEATDPHADEAKVGEGVKLPPIPVPIYSRTQKIGYCVMRVEFDGAHTDPEERRIAVPRVTNDLYIEFSATLEKNADGPAECASRVGKRTDKFVIYEAEFYEKIMPGQTP